MSLIALAVIAGAAAMLVVVGVIAGFAIGANDEHIDVLARRLAAEQRLEQATRATLQAMRNAVRDRNR